MNEIDDAHSERNGILQNFHMIELFVKNFLLLFRVQL
jgi:hypothetical protein